MHPTKIRIGYYLWEHLIRHLENQDLSESNVFGFMFLWDIGSCHIVQGVKKGMRLILYKIIYSVSHLN
jgi:hypothetical protein